MYLSPLRTFTIKCITFSKNLLQNLLQSSLKISFNHKFCHLVPPQKRHSLSFVQEHLQKPPQLIYYWSHLLELHIPALSSSSQSSIWSSALFWLWPDRTVTYWSYFPPEWGLKRKSWRFGCYSSGYFKQCHLPSPRNPHPFQSLWKGFYPHVCLQNS